MLLPPLTNKQKEIVMVFLRFRYLNRYHIQRLLNLKDKTIINLWIKDLIKKRYITKLQIENKTFFKRPTEYRLSINGLRFLRTLHIYSENHIKTLYRDDERSQVFISTGFLIVEICLDIETKNREGKFLYLTRQDYSVKGSLFNWLKELHPHLCIRAGNDDTLRWFVVEIIPSSFSRAQVRKKINHYMRFVIEGEWETYMSICSPKVIFICPTQIMIEYVKHYMKLRLNKFEIESLDVCVFLEETVKIDGATSLIFKTC